MNLTKSTTNIHKGQKLLNLQKPLDKTNDHQSLLGTVARMACLARRHSSCMSREQVAEIREVFDLFDRDRDGKINRDELGKVGWPAKKSTKLFSFYFAETFFEMVTTNLDCVNQKQYLKLLI